MKRIIECKNPYFIKHILSLNGTYDKLTYDSSPDIDAFVPEGVWLILIDGSDIAGMINFKCMNNVMWESHIVIFELYRGNGSEQWGILATDYLKEHYGAKNIIAITPYKNAKHYAERVGFEYKTMLKNSIQKDGKLLDQYLLELSLCLATRQIPLRTI